MCYEKEAEASSYERGVGGVGDGGFFGSQEGRESG